MQLRKIKMSNLEDAVEAVSTELSVIADILEKIVYRIEVLEEDTNDIAKTLYSLEEKANRYFNEQGPRQWVIDLSDEAIENIKKWANDETDNS